MIVKKCYSYHQPSLSPVWLKLTAHTVASWPSKVSKQVLQWKIKIEIEFILCQEWNKEKPESQTGLKLMAIMPC